MPKDKTISHRRIRAVAKSEFLEKGFEKASMRDIAGQVGMTQAGLYRHYASKEAMFQDLVRPLVDRIASETSRYETEAYAVFDETEQADAMVQNNAVQMVRDLMAEYHDELRLILCCSHGTSYENFLHDLIWKETHETMKAFDYMRAHGVPIRAIGEDELHVLTSAYITAALEPIAHDWSEEKAARCLDLVEAFFLPAWKHLMGMENGI